VEVIVKIKWQIFYGRQCRVEQAVVDVAWAAAELEVGEVVYEPRLWDFKPLATL